MTLEKRKREKHPDMCSVLHIKYQCYVFKVLGIKVVSEVMHTQKLSNSHPVSEGRWVMAV